MEVSSLRISYNADIKEALPLPLPASSVLPYIEGNTGFPSFSLSSRTMLGHFQGPCSFPPWHTWALLSTSLWSSWLPPSLLSPSRGERTAKAGAPSQLPSLPHCQQGRARFVFQGGGVGLEQLQPGGACPAPAAQLHLSQQLRPPRPCCQGWGAARPRCRPAQPGPAQPGPAWLPPVQLPRQGPEGTAAASHDTGAGGGCWRFQGRKAKFWGFPALKNASIECCPAVLLVPAAANLTLHPSHSG